MNCKEYLLEVGKDDPHLHSVVQELDPTYRDFAYLIERKYNHIYEIDKIVGTSHPNYHGISWLQLFDKYLKRNTSLKKISDCSNTPCDTKYYTSGEEYRSQFYQSREWGLF